MKLSIKAGSTSQTVNIFIRDSSSTTGGGLTGLVFNTSSLVAYYALPKAAAVAITLATLAAVTTAYSSGGFKEIDATNMPGWYRFDLPDAAIASGRFVSLHLKGASNMAPTPIEIELTATDNQSATAFITGVNSIAPPTNWNLMSVDSNGRIDIIKIAGITQTARDLGLSVLLSSGTGTGQLDITAGIPKANVAQLLGTAWLTPGVAGTPDVNAKQHGGTAQTGRDIGASVLLSSGTGTGQLNVTAGVLARVTLTDTVTTYTGNTPQTGDSFTRIGAVGAGLTALGDTRIANLDATVSSRSTYAGGDTSGTTTLLSRLTSGRATLLDNLSSLDATISSVASSITGVAAAVWAVGSRTLTAFGFSVTASTVSDKTGYSISGTKQTLDVLNDISQANVLSQVNGALDAAGTELTAIPTTSGSLRQKLNYVFQKFRNKRIITSSLETMYKEDASTSLGTNTVADDGTTVTIGETN